MLCIQKDCHYYCGALFAEIPPESLKSDNERASREGWDHVTRLNISESERSKSPLSRASRLQELVRPFFLAVTQDGLSEKGTPRSLHR